MTEEATISAAVLNGFDRQLAAQAVDHCALGRACGIPEQAWTTPHHEVRLGPFVRLLERGADACASQAFGWAAGRDFDLEGLGEVGETIVSAPTLGGALSTFARFLQLVQSTSQMTLEIGADKAVMSYSILDPDIWPRRQDAEFTLSIIHALMARSLGDDWKPVSVEFEHAPARRRQWWNETVGTECAFERRQNAIAIALPALDSPMPERDRSRWHRKSGHLIHALGIRNRAQPVRDRVASALFACLGKGPVDQQAVAQALAMSCRTMHRRLEAEGTRFSDVLADCRIRLALHALAHDGKPLARIAEDLGYSDQSAFTRAFKQHCHMTPIAYRRRARAPAA